MSKQEKLKKLFEKMRCEKHHKGQVFNEDGIVNEEQWDSEGNKKILFF